MRDLAIQQNSLIIYMQTTVTRILGVIAKLLRQKAT